MSIDAGTEERVIVPTLHKAGETQRLTGTCLRSTGRLKAGPQRASNPFLFCYFPFPEPAFSTHFAAASHLSNFGSSVSR